MIKLEILLPVLILVVGFGGPWLFRTLSARRQGASTSPTLCEVDPLALSAYLESTDLSFETRTCQDTLPGGLSAAMMPALLDTRNGDPTKGQIVLRNVNVGGSPVRGITKLSTARLRPDLVRAVQFIRVPLGGPGAVAHAHLRFLFAPGGAELAIRRETVDANRRSEDQSDDLFEPLEDLVLSWEAWRPPGVDFHMIRGLDPTTYSLSLRAYSGPQRFLEDALGSRDWYVYTLKLPGGVAGAADLLRVALRLGNEAGQARLEDLLGQAGDGNVTNGKKGNSGTAADWSSVRQALNALERTKENPAGPDSQPRERTPSGYQTLLRSCGSMLLYSINQTLAEPRQANGAGSPARIPQADLAENPDWMTSLAFASKLRVCWNAPRALLFLKRNPTSIPGWIPGHLDRAGLLEREGGSPRLVHYSMDHATPWGHRDHLLVR